MPNSALQKTIWGLIAAAITFLLSVSVNAFLAYRLNEVKVWTLHTHQVIEDLKDVLLSMQELESDDRGYAVSGNPIFTLSYKTQRKQFLGHLDRVTESVSDNPQQAERAARARSYAQAKLKFIDDVYRTPFPEGAKLINSGQGVALMVAFRGQIGEMIDAEEKLLQERNDALLAIQRTNWFITALLGCCSLVFLIWVFRITRQAIGDEQKRVAILEAEIEERKKVEANLLLTTQKLSSSNVDLQQFAYVASHDLQEPLRAVAGFLTLIVSKNKGKLDPETEGWINHAVEGAQRMRTLINDLLSYARVESQGKALVLVDCNTALEQAKESLAVLLKENEAEIISEKLPSVIGDVGQLAQLFQNLIGNAIKFRTADRPVVIIKVQERHSDWVFSVADNGIGFDPEHAKRIFVIFQRLHGRDEYKGTGIGLALCKKIIERHGGRIWALSQPGAGSTFNFSIPVVSDSKDLSISGHAARTSVKTPSVENPPD